MAWRRRGMGGTWRAVCGRPYTSAARDLVTPFARASSSRAAALLQECMHARASLAHYAPYRIASRAAFHAFASQGRVLQVHPGLTALGSSA